MEENVKVVFRPFDCDFRGAVLRKYDDGEIYYTIVINENLSEEEQIRTFRHEIAHIVYNDFDSNIPIGEIEAIRHASI